MSSPSPRKTEPAAVAEAFGDAAIDRCTLRMVEGDRSAYEMLFRRRVAFVESESRRRLGRRGDLADDVAQETWLRVARGPRRCTSSASLDAWLRRIVRSAAIDLLRRELAQRCRDRRVAETRPEAVDFLADFDLLEEIRREAAAIEGISREDRSIFEMLIRSGATVAQLARALGLGRAALDSRLRRAAARARARRFDP